MIVHRVLHINPYSTTVLSGVRDDIEEKMRRQEEIVSMFEATKKQLDEIEEAPRTGDSLQEAKRLMLSSQLSILSWMLGDTKNEK